MADMKLFAGNATPDLAKKSLTVYTLDLAMQLLTVF